MGINSTGINSRTLFVVVQEIIVIIAEVLIKLETSNKKSIYSFHKLEVSSLVNSQLSNVATLYLFKTSTRLGQLKT
ncbi:hypothetical protein BpHYR1_035117 [Brachionus plicatilis]|uniref:Uncharacterized protein n=1 Tax=Brachionus plicatilis TaxID=10195 RepID=A0A3M7RJJ8_BRAPC|nr:hypothetical protein BpHYR1_035117 [Brachionus plicatilis]